MTTPTIDDIASAGGLEGGIIVPITRPGDEPGPIRRAIVSPSEEWLDIEPRPRQAIFEVEDPDGGFPRAALHAGIVGLLVSPGGVGKTTILLAMALSVATGCPFFGWRPATRGRVFLGLGEEDLEEARRRLYYLARTAGLSDAQRRDALANIAIAPLAGTPVSLLERGPEGNPVETETMRDLRAALAAGGEPWALVILDPLSRWGGLDVETDNAQATRAVEAFESLTKAKGRPAVILAHHTNKTSRREGERDATAARGATALVDGARWVASLTNVSFGPVRGVELELVKSNYTGEIPRMLLARGEDGVLRVMPRSEIEAAKVQAAAEKDAELEERILETIRGGEYTSEAKLRAAVRCKMDALQRALGSMMASGQVSRAGRGAPFKIVEAPK